MATSPESSLGAVYRRQAYEQIAARAPISAASGIDAAALRTAEPALLTRCSMADQVPAHAGFGLGNCASTREMLDDGSAASTIGVSELIFSLRERFKYTENNRLPWRKNARARSRGGELILWTLTSG